MARTEEVITPVVWAAIVARVQGLMALLIIRTTAECTPFPVSFQILTDTGMPRLDMVFNADALTHASVFCCGSLRAFIADPMMRL